MRDLGNMGESVFALWCNQVGLTANSSRIDRTGWDFFIEFPVENDRHISLDMQQAPLECKVQVKATDKQDRKLPIKLSTLERLIKTQMPAFFCFIEFDRGNDPVSAFLVHVGKDIIEKTLQRLREADISEKRDKINKMTLTIHYENPHKLNQLDGVSLKEAILSYVEQGIESYINQKNKLINSLGFEDGNGHIRFNLEGKENFQDFVDVFLGRKSEVSIKQFIVTKKRFGIEEKLPCCISEEGKLSILNPIPFVDGQITIKENLLSAGISLPARMYVLPQELYTILPQEMFRFRIKTEYFDLIIEPFVNKANISFSFDGEKRLELNSLTNEIKFLFMIISSTESLLIDLIFSGFPKLSFRSSSMDLNSRCDHLNFNIAEKLNEELNCLDETKSLCLFFGIDDRVSMTRYEILKSKKLINNMYLILNVANSQLPQDKVLLFESEVKENKEKFFLEENLNNTVCLCFIHTDIGNYRVGFIFSLIGKVKIFAKKYTLISEKVSIDYKIAIPSNQSMDYDSVNQELKLQVDNICNTYLENNYTVIQTFQLSNPREPNFFLLLDETERI